MARLVVFALALLLSAGGALAQAGPAPQPYAGLDVRAVKALSDVQIADLRAGRGMGLALPAELNGYPGPTHVLEHAVVVAMRLKSRELRFHDDGATYPERTAGTMTNAFAAVR